MRKNGHKKRAGALCSGFDFVLLISIFDYRDYFVKVSRYAAAAVVDAIFHGDLYIKHIINQFKVCYLAVDRSDAWGSANKICYLVGI